MSAPVEKMLSETRRVFQALGEVSDQALVTLGISAHQRALLRVLAREHRPATAASLARATLTPVRETARALAALRCRGWLECHADGLDDPESTVSISRQGRRAWSDAQAKERAMLSRLEAALDEQAIHSTFATLRAVRRLLQRPAVSGSAPDHVRQLARA
jgi:DNA-binding MarR family transcriptional regulator